MDYGGPVIVDAALVSGLVRNPAAPVDLVLRLIDSRPGPALEGLRQRAHLSPALQEAMAGHPSRKVRGALARHRDAEPAIRARLLTDPQWWVVIRAFGARGQRPLSDEAVNALLSRIDELPDGVTPDGLLTVQELYAELWDVRPFDLRLFRLAAVHPRPGVREFATGVMKAFDEPLRQALLHDPDEGVRARAADHVAWEQRVMQPADLPDHHMHAFWDVLQRRLSRELVDQVVASDDPQALYFVGPNPTTPPDVVEALLSHPVAEVRVRLAGRADLSTGQLLRLAADPDVAVRTAVSVHPGLTEEQRATIAISPDEETPGAPPSREEALRWARSVNPLLRRRAARNPGLPADLVTALAGDADPGVRVLLALHHPDAPPELMLSSYLDHPGSRRELAELPRFPTEGLARFAGHADPAVRRLVARDPLADPQLIARMSADPDLTVRQANASCPRLPVERLTALLEDPELAGSAAANPALPAALMDYLSRLPPSTMDTFPVM